MKIAFSRSKLTELFAEFLGTFFFMFLLFVSPLILRGNEPLVIGFSFIVFNIAFGIFAKGHFNPIFSFGDFVLVVIKAVSSKDYSKVKEEAIKFGSYLGVQLLAGIVALLIANRLTNIITDYQLVAGGYEGSAEAKDQLLSSTQFGSIYLDRFVSLAFFLEFMFSMVLVLLYQMTAFSKEKAGTMPYVVGLGYFIFSVFAKDISGASFNPVRSSVAAIFEGGQNLNNLWLYLLAPLLGAAVAAILYYVLTLVKTAKQG